MSVDTDTKAGRRTGAFTLVGRRPDLRATMHVTRTEIGENVLCVFVGFCSFCIPMTRNARFFLMADFAV